jgi:hypothetical protein
MYGQQYFLSSLLRVHCLIDWHWHSWFLLSDSLKARIDIWLEVQIPATSDSHKLRQPFNENRAIVSIS